MSENEAVKLLSGGAAGDFGISLDGEGLYFYSRLRIQPVVRRRGRIHNKQSLTKSSQMFTWLNKQGVRSEEGFEVQSVGRFAIEYREGTQVVTLDVERGSCGGGSSVAIRSDAFVYWDNSRLANSLEKQAKMRANFVAAMKFQDIAVEP